MNRIGALAALLLAGCAHTGAVSRGAGSATTAPSMRVQTPAQGFEGPAAPRSLLTMTLPRHFARCSTCTEPDTTRPIPADEPLLLGCDCVRRFPVVYDSASWDSARRAPKVVLLREDVTGRAGQRVTYSIPDLGSWATAWCAVRARGLWASRSNYVLVGAE